MQSESNGKGLCASIILNEVKTKENGGFSERNQLEILQCIENISFTELISVSLL